MLLSPTELPPRISSSLPRKMPAKFSSSLKLLDSIPEVPGERNPCTQTVHCVEHLWCIVYWSVNSQPDDLIPSSTSQICTQVLLAYKQVQHAHTSHTQIVSYYHKQILYRNRYCTYVRVLIRDTNIHALHIQTLAYVVYISTSKH